MGKHALSMLLGLLLAGVAVAENRVDVSLGPPTAPVHVGEVLEIPILVSSAEPIEIFGVELALMWDPQRLLFLNVQTTDTTAWPMSVPGAADGVPAEKWTPQGRYFHAGFAAFGKPYLVKGAPRIFTATFFALTPTDRAVVALTEYPGQYKVWGRVYSLSVLYPHEVTGERGVVSFAIGPSKVESVHPRRLLQLQASQSKPDTKPGAKPGT